MEDCQDERYCPFCGQKAELDGTQYHALFCTTAPASLTSLGERAQTLAARMGQEHWAKVFYDFCRSAQEVKTRPIVTDPDGALTPLPVKPILQRTVSAPSHDFIGALYKPYMSPI